ncbi:MAG: hypothetical protein IKC70_05465 [Bacteroidaceae bacterium]|nr:hypothetical protein [Bacteroidaceae bacterium]
MKEQERYSSLKRALQRRENKQKRLSTNFTYTTMLRVKEAAVAREKRENRIQFFATVAASLLMIIGAVYIIAPIMENYTFSIIPQISISEHIDTLNLYAPIIIATILLLLLDIKLRKIFKKKLKE